MVINIPISLDVEEIERAINKDLERQVAKILQDKINRSFVETYGDVGGYIEHQMRDIYFTTARTAADKIIEQNQDEIIDRVCSRISQRLSNRKKFKDAVAITVSMFNDEED